MTTAAANASTSIAVTVPVLIGQARIHPGKSMPEAKD